MPAENFCHKSGFYYICCMNLFNWNINIWRSHGFSFLFHYQGKWNGGTEKRLYILWWEINAVKQNKDE